MSTLPEAISQHWRRYLEEYEPLRPELYRYCRYLSKSPWEADDLVQDTLMRSFVTLACVHEPIRNPRSWMFRIATNLWLNQVRARRELPIEPPEPAGVSPHDALITREAAGSLIGALAPQERAAVVLKDVFDLSLEDTAAMLSTTVGAVKSALHRGRGKLADPEPPQESPPRSAVVDAFCDAFNRRDLDGVAALLLESAVVEFPGLAVEYGAEAAKRGSLAGVLFGDPTSDRSGIGPAFRQGLKALPPRIEAREHRGETLLLTWFSHEGGDAVRAISRVELAGDRIAVLRTYLHAPELIAELCREMAVPFRLSGYRYWS